jgi:hypothetical protein
MYAQAATINLVMGVTHYESVEFAGHLTVFDEQIGVEVTFTLVFDDKPALTRSFSHPLLNFG